MKSHVKNSFIIQYLTCTLASHLSSKNLNFFMGKMGVKFLSEKNST